MGSGFFIPINLNLASQFCVLRHSFCQQNRERHFTRSRLASDLRVTRSSFLVRMLLARCRCYGVAANLQEQSMKSNRGMLVWAPIVVLLCLSAAFSQANSYQQTNLVSDIPGMAAHTDANLVNPWGISFVPQQPLWIANNGSGTSTIYDQAGATALPPVTIPPPTGGSGTGTVTGTVANTTGGFALNSVPQFFIFATEDGTISAWSQGAAATIAVNNSAAGAVYKGLASGSVGAANFIYAANFSQGRVDVFDASYHPATLAGNFTDPT